MNRKDYESVIVDDQIKCVQRRIDSLENIRAIYETAFDINEGNDVPEWDYNQQYLVAKIKTGTVLMEKIEAVMNSLNHVREFNSCVNQDIKGNLVGKDVFACATTMVSELLTAHDLDPELGFEYYDYLVPTGQCEGEELTEDDRDEKLKELEEKKESVNAIMNYYEERADELHGEENEEEMQCFYMAKYEIGNTLYDELERIMDELTDMYFEDYPEVYEWWLVSNQLARKLKGLGEVIIEDYSVKIWGRQCSGQAILLDHVISQVCEEMEILDGQRFSWKKG